MPMVSMAHECPWRVRVQHGCRSLAQGCSPAMGHATLMVPSYHDLSGHAGWILDGYPTLGKRRPLDPRGQPFQEIWRGEPAMVQNATDKARFVLWTTLAIGRARRKV
jgi:hypothetical protein